MVSAVHVDHFLLGDAKMHMIAREDFQSCVNVPIADGALVRAVVVIRGDYNL